MMTRTHRRAAAAAAALAGLASLLGTGAALAQDAPAKIGAEGAWTAFQADSPKECWAVSPPKKTVNTRDGKPVEAQRGDIRLYIAYRPGQAGEVTFGGGYPFASGSTVEVSIGGKAFKLFTDGENAWAGSPDDDVKLITALRAGSEAVVTGRSGRGTTTVDTFSLSGITAMTKLAKEKCAK